MTINSVELMWSRNDTDAAGQDNKKKLVFSFTEGYQIFCTPDTSLLEIYSAPGLPAYGTPYPGLPPYVFAGRARIRQVSPIYYMAEVTYSGELSLLAGNQIGSPFDARPRIRWVVREEQKEVDEDWNGNRICNVLGEPLTARVTFYERTAIVTRNMKFFSTYLMSDYDFAVNSDPVLGWPPGTARVKLTAQNVFNDVGDGYWEVTGEFTFKRPYRTTADKAWYSRIRHDGYYHLPGNPPVGPVSPVGPFVTLADAVQAVDKNKVPVSRPVQLDLNGYRLTDGTARWLEIQHFQPLPFSSIGILP